MKLFDFNYPNILIIKKRILAVQQTPYDYIYSYRLFFEVFQFVIKEYSIAINFFTNITLFTTFSLLPIHTHYTTCHVCI